MTEDQAKPLSAPATQEPEAIQAARPFRPKRLAALLVLGLLGLFFVFRWAGTSHRRVVVQRVYEEGAVYRVELAEPHGEVLVAQNTDMLFPYLKLDSADQHAKLSHFAKTGDQVDLTLWGFRFAWLSVFPNVVDSDFAVALEDRHRAKAEKIAERVVQELSEKGLIQATPETRARVVAAVTAALSSDSN